MSFDTHRNWFYQLHGKQIHLWQYSKSGNTDLVGGNRVRVPSDFHGSQLIYPNESITNGLKIEHTTIDVPFVNEDHESTTYSSLTEDTSPDTTSHINVNRMLALSIVDYVKSQVGDSQGDVNRKEYYMREFWKKVGDNESNKRKTSMSFPTSPFAVR